MQRGDNPDLAGEQRQWAFPGRFEQAVGFECAFQLVERYLQRAHPLWLQLLAHDLILALRLVNGHTAPRDDPQSVFRGEP